MNLKDKPKIIATLIVFIFCTSTAFTQTVVRVINQLGEGQIGENIQISIGNLTKTLSVNQSQPQAYADFYFNGPGVYQCRIDSVSQLYGESFSRRGYGAGNLTINGGEIFSFNGDFSKNPYQITLTMAGQLQNAQPRSNMASHSNQSQSNTAWIKARLNQINIQIRQLQGKITEAERSLRYYKSSGDRYPSGSNNLLQIQMTNLIQSYQDTIAILEREKNKLGGY